MSTTPPTRFPRSTHFNLMRGGHLCIPASSHYTRRVNPEVQCDCCGAQNLQVCIGIGIDGISPCLDYCMMCVLSLSQEFIPRAYAAPTPTQPPSQPVPTPMPEQAPSWRFEPAGPSVDTTNPFGTRYPPRPPPTLMTATRWHDETATLAPMREPIVPAIVDLKEEAAKQSPTTRGTRTTTNKSQKTK